MLVVLGIDLDMCVFVDGCYTGVSFGVYIVRGPRENLESDFLRLVLLCQYSCHQTNMGFFFTGTFRRCRNAVFLSVCENVVMQIWFYQFWYGVLLLVGGWYVEVWFDAYVPGNRT